MIRTPGTYEMIEATQQWPEEQRIHGNVNGLCECVTHEEVLSIAEYAGLALQPDEHIVVSDDWNEAGHAWLETSYDLGSGKLKQILMHNARYETPYGVHNDVKVLIERCDAVVTTRRIGQKVTVWSVRVIEGLMPISNVLFDGLMALRPEVPGGDYGNLHEMCESYK